jgi:AhpD family alkylhydroperoxidase
MKARIPNPAMLLPGALEAVQALAAIPEKSGLPLKTLGLVHLRASQINGCSVCVDMHPRLMKHAGETEERHFAVSAWRDAPYFSDAERAALALTEATTRLSDREDQCPMPYGTKRRGTTTNANSRRLYSRLRSLTFSTALMSPPGRLPVSG